MNRETNKPTVIRGPALTFTGNPFTHGLEHTAVHESDAIVVMANGLITDFGAAREVLPRLTADRGIAANVDLAIMDLREEAF